MVTRLKGSRHPESGDIPLQAALLSVCLPRSLRDDPETDPASAVLNIHLALQKREGGEGEAVIYLAANDKLLQLHRRDNHETIYLLVARIRAGCGHIAYKHFGTAPREAVRFRQTERFRLHRTAWDL